MKRVLMALVVIASYPLIAAGSCATTGEPTVRIVEVKVPVAQPCPDKRGPKPTYIDTLDAMRDAATQGADVLVALILGGREQRIQREAESDRQIEECAT